MIFKIIICSAFIIIAVTFLVKASSFYYRTKKELSLGYVSREWVKANMYKSDDENV